MLFDGEEENETLAPKFKDLAKFLDKGVTSAGTRLTPWEGGDLKWSNRIKGMSGNFATQDQCLWCLVPRHLLASLTPYPARTLNLIRVHAHLPPLGPDGESCFPFTCEHCQSTYNFQSQVDNEALTAEQIKVYSSIHKGVMWHQGPLTNTPIDHIVPCAPHATSVLLRALGLVHCTICASQENRSCRIGYEDAST